MSQSTPDCSLEAGKVHPASQTFASQSIAEGKIPVLSCEGPCIRSKVAHLAAQNIEKDENFIHCSPDELFPGDYEHMVRWAEKADKVIVIDGCFLQCLGKTLQKLIGEKNVILVDAMAQSKKYTDHFDVDAIPEVEQKKIATDVANWIQTRLGKNGNA